MQYLFLTPCYDRGTPEPFFLPKCIALGVQYLFKIPCYDRGTPVLFFCQIALR